MRKYVIAGNWKMNKTPAAVSYTHLLLLLEPFLLHADPAKECFREDLDPKILAARRVARDYADMFLPLDGLLAAASVIEEPSHWSGDGVHPNEAGSRLIGRYYAEAFAAMLGK